MLRHELLYFLIGLFTIFLLIMINHSNKRLIMSYKAILLVFRCLNLNWFFFKFHCDKFDRLFCILLVTSFLFVTSRSYCCGGGKYCMVLRTPLATIQFRMWWRGDTKVPVWNSLIFEIALQKDVQSIYYIEITHITRECTYIIVNHAAVGVWSINLSFGRNVVAVILYDQL